MAHGCELPPYGLNGFGPSLNMDSARDRVVSILLGKLVVYVIFTTIWPKSALLDVRVHLSRILSTLAEIASLSAMKASRAGITAAEAGFMPKVCLGAIAAGGNSSLSASNLPNIAQISSASGVVVGASMPIFDGGLRAAQLRNAESRAAASEATFKRVRDEAAREIVVAANTLRSALASYTAATALAQAAQTTYDAAFSAYQAGVGNISVATEADSGLLTARQAQSDGHAASLVAAANLAFALGAMTSSDVASGLVAR